MVIFVHLNMKKKKRRLDLENKTDGQPATLIKIKLDSGFESCANNTKDCVTNNKISASTISGYPESSICEIGSANIYC